MEEALSVRAAIEHRNLTKAAQTLLGICAGITADGHVNDHEVQFLHTWLRENSDVAATWPGNIIAKRVQGILADGVITAEERADLLETLQDLSGNRFVETGAALSDAPFLPVDDDPSIYFRDMTFCFTGRFLFGTRAACERVVMKLGAMPVDTITKRLDYLVVGAMVSPEWVNTTYGRKIEKALRYRSEGGLPVIVTEQQWTHALEDALR